jgi:hypothetical protein
VPAGRVVRGVRVESGSRNIGALVIIVPVPGLIGAAGLF